MQQIADLHIHSKYARACSPQLTLENIDRTCRRKGVDIIATGDFTYPAWFLSLKNELEEIAKTGLYKLKKAKDDKVKFILSTEVSLIYKDNGKVRKLHIMLHAPNIEAVEKLNKYLDKNFNIRSDGRPILGMSAPDLVKLCLKIDPKFLIYPAHIWTPWFAVFGSKSGFDSLEECFADQAKHIYAYETGLSSDPEMNWRVSALDNLTMLSSSDAHSLANIAREATVFDLEKITYDEIYRVIKEKDLKSIKKTIEFFPEEGMYHNDGHRDCGICLTPQETKKYAGICPKCKKPLIVGVLSRVDDLADRPLGGRPKNSYPFVKIIELDKIIAQVFEIKTRNSKRVLKEYDLLIENFSNELDILLNVDVKKLEKVCDPRVATAIAKVRAGDVQINPGFDGQYGELIF